MKSKNGSAGKDLVLGVIPVRYNSSRLPGKPLIPLRGKPLIQRVYERASKSKLLDSLFVATDDQRIENKVKGFGGKVVLTSQKPKTGSDRVAEAVKNLNYDLVLNIQGDEPFLKPEMLDELISFMQKNKYVRMGTLAKKVKDKDFFENPDRVKVVLDKNGNAIYFSRFPVPFRRKKEKSDYYEHIGVYAFRKKFLSRYAELKQTPWEKSESLEQLRVLENGYKIKVLLTKYGSKSINSHVDLKGIKKRS
ncbi:MAG: 3-deoxy-manno-octulosonate cytidylyltransferase [candidate division Zixibacteria bacterium]|nr:3-deoxy-manno-octulosonate cytidylyltransferase [candidate division Zixibacteria bacterium]